MIQTQHNSPDVIHTLYEEFSFGDALTTKHLKFLKAKQMDYLLDQGEYNWVHSVFISFFSLPHLGHFRSDSFGLSIKKTYGLKRSHTNSN